MLSQITLTFRNLNLSLKDCYVIKKQLNGKLVNQIDSLKTSYGTFKVKMAQSEGRINEQTKVFFRSQSCTYYFFIEISLETYDQNINCQKLNFELYTEKFREIVELLNKRQMYCDIRVICYSRIFYNSFTSLEEILLHCLKHNLNYKGFQMNQKGEIFKEFYEYIDLNIPDETKKLTKEFQKLLHRFMQEIYLLSKNIK